jgi:agmatine deiminase
MISRRTFLTLAPAPFLLKGTSMNEQRRPADLDDNVPGPGWRMPAEWAPHARCWMAFPSRTGPWEDFLEPVRRDIVALARAIRRFEPVMMVVSPDEVDQAARALGPAIEVLPLPVDDLWIRDSGPTFLSDGTGGTAAAVWRFNAWGEKFPSYANDRTLAERLTARIGMILYAAPLVTEGGALLVDGDGTLVVTETSILNENRNPGLTKREADRILKSWLGVETVIWLPGSRTETVTDGHIDGFACFARPGVALAELPASESAPDAREMNENLKALRLARDARGRSIEIGLLRRPPDVLSDASTFCDCYVNFYIANGGIVMSKFGSPAADQAARDTIAAAFPDREVVQIFYDAVAEGGGGIHCSTQQQPAAGEAL